MPISNLNSSTPPEPINYLIQLISSLQTAFSPRDAVRYRKVAGHKFSTIFMKELTFCSKCRKFIWGAWSYSCQSCKLVCHEKCVNEISATCANNQATTTTTSIKSIEASQQSSSFADNHQPYGHSFSEETFLTPTYCTHCGTLIMFSKKNLLNLSTKQGLRCRDCKLAIHFDCKKFVCVSCKGDCEPSSFGGHKSLVSLRDFDVVKLLGEGSFSRVFLAELRSSREKFAIKVIKKTNPVVGGDPESVINEKEALKLGKMCPFLVTAHCCFQSEDRLFLVMDYEAGYNLKYLQPMFEMNENNTRFYVSEIVLALKFLHSRSIIYRDLKLENVIIGKHGHCKLVDFGMVKKLTGCEKTRTFCGTYIYMSPEIILERDYDYSVDWWALGVLVHELLIGFPPFRGDSESDLYDRIKLDKFQIPKGYKLSPEADSLLRDLLTKDPNQRLGCRLMDDIKEHPFFMFPTGDGTRSYKWDAIETQQIKPPITPPTNEELKELEKPDTNISWSPVNQSDIQKISQRDFKDFSYYSESFMSLQSGHH